MKKHVLNWLALGLLFFVACQRETSFELGTTPGTGTLQFDATGDCMPKTVSGTYIAGTPLVPTASTITVSVNVLSTGTYLITTDTVNGYYFRAIGTFTSLGPTNIILRSTGTPFAAGINNFVVTYGASVCDIQITVLPAGTGPAVFTLNAGTGTPPSCTTPVIAGAYGAGIALTSANTVVLNVNVTTAGTYSVITTAVNGMTFAGTGTLAVGPSQTITLTGSGTPGTAGNTTIPVTAGLSTCSFVIPVTGPAVFTMVGSPNCTTPVIAGTYTVGTPLDATNTVTLNVMVTTAGAYSVTTAPAVGGMIFTGSGTLALGAQTIVLTGQGTPTTAGPNTIPVTAGATTCSFVITVTAAPTVSVGTLDGGPAPGACTPISVNGTYTVGVGLAAANTVTVQVDVTVAGTYNINTGAAVNGMTFSKTGSVVVGPNQTITLNGSGIPAASGPFTFTVTYGGSSCTFIVTVVDPPLSNDYFPRTTNSNWSYEIDNNPLDSFYRTTIAATLTAQANVYNIFMFNDGTGLDSSGYYRKSGGDYIEWFNYGDWLGLDGPGWASYIMLKDNVTAGTNWKTGNFVGTASGNPVLARFSYTLTQKDIAVSVTTSTGTINYSNVNVVEEKIELFDGTTWQDLTVALDYFGRSYYARGIGLIKFEALDAGGAVTYLQELRRRQVF